jgi:DNA-binding transcriptional LysR family regulator
VSRHIANLERDLGVELIRRTTRQTSLTQAGQDFFQRTAGLLKELEEQVNIISDYQDEVSGLIRVTAPEDMAQTILKDAIHDFEAEFPKVQFEIIVSNEYLDLTKENIDFAFRAGRMADSNLKQRKLIDTQFILVASKGYLNTYGRPSRSEDLAKHKLLAFSSIGFEHFSSQELGLKPYFKCDSFPVLRSMALSNQGIAIVPEFFCRPKLESGELEKILPECALKSAPLHLVFPASKNLPLRNRLFIDRVTG